MPIIQFPTAFENHATMEHSEYITIMSITKFKNSGRKSNSTGDPKDFAIKKAIIAFMGMYTSCCFKMCFSIIISSSDIVTSPIFLII